VLVHLLDTGAMLSEGRDLITDYEAIRRELARYQPQLLERQEIVVLNKTDLTSEDAVLEPVESALRERGVKARRLSGATGEGTRELVHCMLEAVDAAIAAERADEAAADEEDARSERR
jgi:GTP-binding protein